MPTNPTARQISELSAAIRTDLERLCHTIPNRHVGSLGNRQATAYFAETIAACGFDVACPEFDCLDWQPGPLHLQAGSETFTAHVGPYSPPCSVTAPLLECATLAQLEQADPAGRLLLISGELAAEPLLPKNFPFYIPVTHPGLPALLEQKRPAAIIAATTHHPGLAGGLSPFPLIEDGDFPIPSVYMTAAEGRRLRRHAGRPVSLSIESRRIPARACNVIARLAPVQSPRLIICAHIDAQKDTPGALDNAAGVAVLLALARLLAGYTPPPALELIAFNGEDYYSAPGQAHYLRTQPVTPDSVLLAINIDVAGCVDSPSAYSLYGCPGPLAGQLHAIFGRHHLVQGDPWYQSDHAIFIQNQIPAVAITSQNFVELSTHITHTPRDNLTLVHPPHLAHIAYALKDLALAIPPTT